MVKLDYKAIVAAGRKHNPCDTINDIESFAEAGQYANANAVIASNMRWIKHRIRSEHFELFPAAFIKAMKHCGPHDRFAAAKALGVTYLLDMQDRHDGTYYIRTVSNMEILIDKVWYAVNTTTASISDCTLRALFWNVEENDWAGRVELPDSVTKKLLEDPAKAKKEFTKIIKKHMMQKA